MARDYNQNIKEYIKYCFNSEFDIIEAENEKNILNDSGEGAYDVIICKIKLPNLIQPENTEFCDGDNADHVMGEKKKLKMLIHFNFQKREEDELNPNNDPFIFKATSIVIKHLDDINFDVESLCRELGMSNTNLYRKLQSSIGLSANKFIKNIRLKKAAMLLKAKNNNVMDVAYLVGFRDAKYFSKSFKKEFGVLPKAFTKN